MRLDALRAGASGFLLKDVPAEDLVDAVRVIAEVARRPAVPEGDAPVLQQLTAREREVLVLLTRGRSNAEIAAELIVSEATVKTHVAHLLMKLGVRDRVQAVILAYETGLVQPGKW